MIDTPSESPANPLEDLFTVPKEEDSSSHLSCSETPSGGQQEVSEADVHSSGQQESSNAEDVEMICETSLDFKDLGCPDLDPDLDPNKMDCDKDTNEKASSEDLCKLLEAKRLEKLGNDSDCSETGSKDSSNVTPSDQRSNTEVRSSLKESDNMSSGSGSSKETKETASKVMRKCEFMRLFTHLPVQYDFSIQPDPAWLMKSNFNDEVQLLYEMEDPPKEDNLLRELHIARALRQPSTVKLQLQRLVKGLKMQEIQESGSQGKTSPASAVDVSEEFSPPQYKNMPTSSEDEGHPLTSSLSDESATKEDCRTSGGDKESEESLKDSGHPSGSDDKKHSSESEEIYERTVLKESLLKVVQSSFVDIDSDYKTKKKVSGKHGSVRESDNNFDFESVDEMLHSLFQEDSPDFTL